MGDLADELAALRERVADLERHLGKTRCAHCGEVIAKGVAGFTDRRKRWWHFACALDVLDGVNTQEE